jgi:transposase-like protein
MAKRYSDQEKSRILDHINKYNASHGGRGGMADASKKYQVSFLTLRQWLGKVQTKKAVPASRNTFGAAYSKRSAEGNNGNLRSKLQFHIDNIERYSRQISELQAQIAKEKEAILKSL